MARLLRAMEGRQVEQIHYSHSATVMRGLSYSALLIFGAERDDA